MHRTAALLFAFALATAARASSFDVTFSRGTSPTTYRGEATVTSVTLAWSRPLSERWESGISLTPIVVDQPRSWFGHLYGDGNEIARAGELALFARRHLDVNWRTALPYFAISAGPMWADRRVPAATSRFNVATALETGLILFRDRPLPILLGARFTHISNGGYSPRNPGLEVMSVVFGTRFAR